jgi:hypothetical protein
MRGLQRPRDGAISFLCFVLTLQRATASLPAILSGSPQEVDIAFGGSEPGNRYSHQGALERQTCNFFSALACNSCDGKDP